MIKKIRIKLKQPQKIDMPEIATILNYPHYAVTRDGRIYSKKRRIFLRPGTNKLGYKFVYLRKNKRPHFCSVHRLVAQAYIPNPDNLPCVNHKDRNPSNNNVENLEWCSFAYNASYMDAGKRRAEKRKINGTNKNAGRKRKPIDCFDLNNTFVKRYDSITQAHAETGINNITEVLKGRHKQAGGFIWKYV